MLKKIKSTIKSRLGRKVILSILVLSIALMGCGSVAFNLNASAFSMQNKNISDSNNLTINGTNISKTEMLGAMSDLSNKLNSYKLKEGSRSVSTKLGNNYIVTQTLSVKDVNPLGANPSKEISSYLDVTPISGITAFTLFSYGTFRYNKKDKSHPIDAYTRYSSTPPTVNISANSKLGGIEKKAWVRNTFNCSAKVMWATVWSKQFISILYCTSKGVASIKWEK
jgi:hypothetical protein